MSEAGVVKQLHDIELIERLLVKHGSQREGDAWVFACNTALRVGDMLNIRFDDVTGRDELVLNEQKTNNKRTVTLNRKAQAIVDRRRKAHPNHVHLFQSVGRNVSEPKPITRQYFNRKLSEVGDIIGIKLSSHSARKTRGYHLLKNGTPLTTICKMFGHSSPSITLKYIGITAEDIEQTYIELEL